MYRYYVRLRIRRALRLVCFRILTLNDICIQSRLFEKSKKKDVRAILSRLFEYRILKLTIAMMYSDNKYCHIFPRDWKPFFILDIYFFFLVKKM